MKVSEALDILEKHNKWRKGADVEQTNAKELSTAIETILLHYKYNVCLN